MMSEKTIKRNDVEVFLLYLNYGGKPWMGLNGVDQSTISKDQKSNLHLMIGSGVAFLFCRTIY